MGKAGEAYVLAEVKTKKMRKKKSTAPTTTVAPAWAGNGDANVPARKKQAIQMGSTAKMPTKKKRPPASSQMSMKKKRPPPSSQMSMKKKRPPPSSQMSLKKIRSEPRERRRKQAGPPSTKKNPPTPTPWMAKTLSIEAAKKMKKNKKIVPQSLATISAMAAVAAVAFSGYAIEAEVATGKKKKTKWKTFTLAEILGPGLVDLKDAEKDAWEEEKARIQTKEFVATVITADGEAAVKEVMLFINDEQDNASEDEELLDEQGALAVGWLVDALEVAPYSPGTVELIHELLAKRNFTANLAGMGQWETLVEGAQNILDKIGNLALQPLYEQNRLGAHLSDALLREHIMYHAASPHGSGQKPSQKLAMPEFFDFLQSRHDFEDYAELPERKCLLPTLMLAALIQGYFEIMIKKLQTKLGSWCKATVAPVKGYARCLVKLYADYLSLPSPRSQWLLDTLRCLLTGPNPTAMHAITAAIRTEFGGVLQLKNPFSLPKNGRADRCHLLLLNSTVVFDSGKTIGELANGPAAEMVFAQFRGATNHGEPKGRWSLLVEDAIATLRDLAMANVPAKMGCEIQFTLDTMSEGRKLAHFAYDIARALTPERLFANFAGAAMDDSDSEEDEDDLFNASYEGQLSAVRELLENGEVRYALFIYFIYILTIQCNVAVLVIAVLEFPSLLFLMVTLFVVLLAWCILRMSTSLQVQPEKPLRIWLRKTITQMFLVV